MPEAREGKRNACYFRASMSRCTWSGPTRPADKNGSHRRTRPEWTASLLRAERRPAVNDPERQDLLRRLDESERARRSASLLIIAVGNAVTGWLALREMVQREQEEREQTEQIMEMESEARKKEAEQAIMDAKEAHRPSRRSRREPVQLGLRPHKHFR